MAFDDFNRLHGKEHRRVATWGVAVRIVRQRQLRFLVTVRFPDYGEGVRWQEDTEDSDRVPDVGRLPFGGPQARRESSLYIYVGRWTGEK